MVLRTRQSAWNAYIPNLPVRPPPHYPRDGQRRWVPTHCARAVTATPGERHHSSADCANGNCNSTPDQ